MSSFAVSVASLSPSPSGSQSLNSSSTVNPSASSSSASSAAPVSSTDSSFFSTDGLLVIGITLSGLGLLLLLLFVWRWKAARRKGRGADAVVPRSTPVLVKRRVSSRTRNKRLSNRSKRSGLKNLKSASSSSKHSEQRRRHRSRSRSVNRAVVRAFSGSSAGTSISDCIPVPKQHPSPQYDSHVSGWVHPSSPQAPGRVVFDGQHNGTRFYQGSLVPGVMPVSALPPLPGFTSPPINTMAMRVPSAVIPTPAALSHPTPVPVPPATQQAHRLRDRRLRMQISLSKAMRKSTLRKHRRRGMSHTPPLDALIALDDDDTVLPSDSISNVVVQVPLDAHRPASDSGSMPAPQVSRVGDAK